MALTDDVKDKIVSTGKDVSDKAKDLANVAKLKAQIAAEGARLKGLYADLGKTFYENPEDESIEVYKDSIAAVRDVISGYQNELMNRKGQRICPNCGAIVSKDALFCGHCGAKCEPEPEPEPEPEEPKVKICPVCSAVMSEDMAFCEVCGAKLDD